MSRRRVAGWGILSVGAVAVAAVLGGWGHSARAQAGLWAIDTQACFTDGSHCIKGIIKNPGSPYATKDACEKAMQQVAQQYHEAKLNVMYIHCVQLKR